MRDDPTVDESTCPDERVDMELCERCDRLWPVGEWHDCGYEGS
jgi:hypothetical protein